MLISILIISIVSIILLTPMYFKPLYCDDGKWYYYAIFRKRGLKQHINYWGNNSYFGIEWISAIFTSLIRKKDVQGILIFKIIWYFFTAISVYFFVNIIEQNEIQSTLSAIIFLMAVSYPKNRFSLTYGESMILLPIMLAYIFAYLSYISGNSFYFFISGFFVSLSINVKVFGFIIAPILLIVTFFTKNILFSLGYYLLGCSFLLFLPLLFLRTNINRKWYIYRIFSNVFTMLESKLKFLNFHNLIFGKSKSEMSCNYVESVLKRSKTDFWSGYKLQVKVIVVEWSIIIILAVVQILSLFLKFDSLVFLMILMLPVFFSFAYIQKSTLIVKLNPIWIPISILAGKSLYTIFIQQDGWNLSKTTLLFILIITVSDIIKKILIEYKQERRSQLADYNLKHSKYFSMAKNVGKYIKVNSNESEKILVWGNFPSVYLYADRECSNHSFFHIYPYSAHNIANDIQLLFNSMKENPPEWIVFYTGIYNKIDKWNMQTLSDEINIPYKLSKDFQVIVGKRKYRSIPVFRRDDVKYRELLLEKYSRSNDVIFLQKVLDFYPNDFATKIRIKFHEEKLDLESKIEFLSKNNQLSKIDKNLLLLDDLMEKENFIDASEIFTDIIVQDKNNLRSMIGLGEIHFAKGEIDLAFHSFQEAIKINPFSADAFNNSGVVLFQVGDLKNAELYFKKALKIDPNFEGAKMNLVALLQKKKEMV